MTNNPFSRFVDGMTGRLGRFISWLTLCMVLIGAYNAIARYLGRFIHASLSSNLYLELQWYLFSLIFLLGAAYALKEDAHVRVDVLYGRLRRKAKAKINVIGSVLMLIPFCVFVLWVSWPSIRNSWIVREGSPDPGGLPRYPLKAVIIVAFALLVLQGISQLLKDVAVLRGPDEEEDEEGEALDADIGARGL
ncbi:MAG: TRAP transporter small permease subunit [Gemmatimonadota bacterium]|nr:TRAP transporter small permease subunit [Gemmatimonadota bacterium]MDE2986002.1 TRAP transporter small permease subunit [Gemmatimonadota bacterium]